MPVAFDVGADFLDEFSNLWHADAHFGKDNAIRIGKLRTRSIS